ncbi:hypothetical protein HRbin39_00973 [bacterium HR39]|nr:hypothetical protein HRbin39_00973 [bacterium HR39]
MAHQQHAEAARIPQPRDQPVELRLAGEIHAGERFVQHQQIGFAQECPGQEQPPELAAGEIVHLAVEGVQHPGLGGGRLDLRAITRAREFEEAATGERQDGIEGKTLGSIAHQQPRRTHHHALVGPGEPEQHPHQRGLAGAVGSHHGDDLAAADSDVHVVEDHVAPAAQHQAAGLHQYLALHRAEHFRLDRTFGGGTGCFARIDRCRRE